MNPSTMQIVGTTLFAIAVIHTFSTKFFEHLAHTRPAHSGLWHLLGEVEVVFGFWAMMLMVAMEILEGNEAALAYIDSLDYTEPLFVFAIMVIAGSRPVLQFAATSVRTIARVLLVPEGMAFYFTTLAFVPLLGSFIAEPAAMTVAALILRDRYYAKGISNRLKYGTLGVLFVNVSIGGTLTPFAAPPVLMVAEKYGWGFHFMAATFGWKAALAVVVNALAVTLAFGRELAQFPAGGPSPFSGVPRLIVGVHLAFLVGVVFFAHHPAVFMGIMLLFLGFAEAYDRYQDRLILREGLLVAFFLAGLVTLGGKQQWWLQPLLAGMDSMVLFFSATALTAITDNAALTYLGSLVEGVTSAYKYALVAGAVAGGGLTVIANAPNPAGFSILKGHFAEQSIHPFGLLIAAFPPTVVAVLAFLML
jgi:Putative Na+/H+ antiporter